MGRNLVQYCMAPKRALSAHEFNLRIGKQGEAKENIQCPAGKQLF